MFRSIRPSTVRRLIVPSYSSHSRHVANMRRSRLSNPALFICDIQEKFRSAIYEFDKVIFTSQKLVQACKILEIPIYVTTQNSARLGATVSELTTMLPSASSSEKSPAHVSVDKTAFSMLVPEITAAITKQSNSPTSGPQVPLEVLLVGIETHICVTQTALDLLSMGHKVYIIQDGVSSCNAGERPVALARLAREGCVVTTSESVLFELVGDAADKDFKAVSGLVKQGKDGTKDTVEIFCNGGGAAGTSAKL